MDDKLGYILVWNWTSDKEGVNMRWEEDKGKILVLQNEVELLNRKVQP